MPDHVRNPARYTVYVLDEPLTVGGGGRGDGSGAGGGGRGASGDKAAVAAAAEVRSGAAATASDAGLTAVDVGSGAMPADYLGPSQIGAEGGAAAALAFGSGAVQFRRRKAPPAADTDAAPLRPLPRGAAGASLQPAAIISAVEEEDEDGSFRAGRAGATEGADDGMEVDGVEAVALGAAPGGDVLGGGKGARVRQFRQRKQQDEEANAS